MKTQIAALVAALFLIIACADGAEGRRWGVVAGDNVRVRSGPAEGYREMCELNRDDLVGIIETSADKRWFRIIAPEKGDVWVHAQYVNVEGERGVLTGDRVRIRVRPDVNAEQVTRLDKGAVVKVKGRDGDWVKIAPPEGADAWISAEYVRPMTDEDLALFRQKKAEEERERAELARTQGEAAMVAEADGLLAAELNRPVEKRSLSNVLQTYQNMQGQIKDAALLERVGVQLALVRAMQDVQAALAQKAAPAPLPKLDFDQAKAKHDIGRAVDDLLAAHERAQKLAAKQTVQVIPSPAEREIPLDGWVFYLGPGLEGTGATHRIIRDGRVLALVRSQGVDLGAFMGTRVRLTGKVSGEADLSAGERAKLVEVARIEPAFE